MLKIVIQDSSVETLSTLMGFRCDDWSEDDPCFTWEVDSWLWGDEDWYLMKRCIMMQKCPGHLRKRDDH